MSVEANPISDSAERRWLSIVGIGEDGAEGLSPRARALVERAVLVIGSERQLALADKFIKGERATWPSPLPDAIPALLARRGQSVCVLASGDPFFYGIGATLSAHIASDEYVCVPQPSSLSLACARLGWPLQDVAIVTLHGRALEHVVPYLQPRNRILVLSWDERTPHLLAEFLRARGFGSSVLHVLEALGGPREKITSGRADTLKDETFGALNIAGIEVAASNTAHIVPLSAGLPDEFFEHDGQITKREVRAMTLSALAPRVGELLWDVGAGSGSIAIEWMLSHVSCRAIAVEAREDRARRIARNAAALGVPSLRIVAGKAPDALPQLAHPDAVFIGGGAQTPGLFEACWSALKPGGRLTVNGVSLGTETMLLRWHAAHGGSLRRISVERAGTLGTMTCWRSALPVTQWSIVKP